MCQKFADAFPWLSGLCLPGLPDRPRPRFLSSPLVGLGDTGRPERPWPWPKQRGSSESDEDSMYCEADTERFPPNLGGGEESGSETPRQDEVFASANSLSPAEQDIFLGEFWESKFLANLSNESSDSSVLPSEAVAEAAGLAPEPVVAAGLALGGEEVLPLVAFFLSLVDFLPEALAEDGDDTA